MDLLERKARIVDIGPLAMRMKMKSREALGTRNMKAIQTSKVAMRCNRRKLKDKLRIR
jgi:hypothetical protein